MTALQNTSVAETHRFIKEFIFSPSFGISPQKEITFSDTTKIRLDIKNSIVRLKLQDNGYYPITGEHWFKLWISNPKSLRKLLMIQIYDTTPDDALIKARINDGTNDLYWDGAAWSIAGVGNWNDEATINANIEEFPILPDREFAVVINLATTDKYVTPYITSVKVLMEIKIDYIEDILYRSLMTSMKSGILPVANLPLTATLTDTSSIDLNDWEIDTSFDIVDVDAVYNFSTDSELLYNILTSYNTSTKIITLSTPILTGDIPFIIFRYSPEISYTTNQDYFKVDKVPCIILNKLEVPTSQAYSNLSENGIVNKGDGSAVLVKEPWRATFEIQIHVITDKGVDHCRLLSAVLKYFDDNLMLKSVGLDEFYRMHITKEFREITESNDADLIAKRAQLEIMDVRMPFVSENTTGIMRVNITMKGPKTSKEDPVLGGSHIIFRSHNDDTPSAWEETFEITK